MRWAGFVRNVMIGREGLHREVLLELTAAAGGADPQSHLATGNVTFSATATQGATVARNLSAAISQVIGRSEPVITRTLPWLQGLVEASPFEAIDPATHELEVAFLPLDARPLDVARVCGADGLTILACHDREVFAARRRGPGARPHVLKVVEAASGTRATARAWSTVQRVTRNG